MSQDIDQTAEILDRLGTPEQRRDYALMNATCQLRADRQAAREALHGPGGNLRDFNEALRAAQRAHDDTVTGALQTYDLEAICRDGAAAVMPNPA